MNTSFHKVNNQGRRYVDVRCNGEPIMQLRPGFNGSNIGEAKRTLMEHGVELDQRLDNELLHCAAFLYAGGA